MGNVSSADKPAEVDLLPPRFDTPPNPLDRLHVTPVEHLVGRGSLHALLTNHFVNEPLALAAPEFGCASKAAGNVLGDPRLAAALALGSAGDEYVPADHPTGVVTARLSMVPSVADNLAPTVGVVTSNSSNNSKVAASARLSQVETSPFWAADAVISDDMTVRGSALGMTSAGGIAGNAHVRLSSQRAPGTGAHADAADDAGAAAGAGAGDVIGVSGGGRRSRGLRSGPVSDAALGMRWVKMDGSVSAGGTVDLGAPGSNVPGVRNAWTQVNMASWRAGVSVTREDGDDGTSRYEPLASLSFVRKLRDETRPSFEVGLAGDVRGDRQVLSFVNHVVTRRKVRNLFEESHVKGIYNFVDVGFALDRRAGEDLLFSAAAAWQVNKNLLVKGKVSNSATSWALSIKTSMDPVITVSVGTRYNFATRTATPGVFFSLSKGDPVEYTRASPEALRRVEAKHVRALHDPTPATEEPFASSSPGASPVPTGNLATRVNNVRGQTSSQMW